MSNELEVSMILIKTTSVLSVVRTTPESMNIMLFLKRIKSFYSQDISKWNYVDFLQLFSDNCPRGSFEEFSDSVYFKYKKPAPTDNVLKISEFRLVFSRFFDHAVLLCSEHKTDQLKDFFDSIHCLSEALLWKDKWDSKGFWKTYIKPYCKRWHVKFPGMRKLFIKFL